MAVSKRRNLPGKVIDLETLLRRRQDEVRGGPELPEIDRRTCTERLDDLMDKATTWAGAIAIGVALVGWTVLCWYVTVAALHAMIRAIL